MKNKKSILMGLFLCAAVAFAGCNSKNSADYEKENTPKEQKEGAEQTKQDEKSQEKSSAELPSEITTAPDVEVEVKDISEATKEDLYGSVPDEETVQGNGLSTKAKWKAPSAGSLELGQIENYKAAKEQKNGMTMGMELPYTMKGTDLVIESIGSYSGAFVEDGSDEEEDGVCAVVITNASDETLQYGEMHFTVNDTDSALFKVTTLTPGTSALVLEANRKGYAQKDRYVFEEIANSSQEKTSLQEDLVQLTCADGNISLTNLSSEDLGTVYVYYKTIQKGGLYLGGITYRVKFENVAAGAVLNKMTGHYLLRKSQVLMVDHFKEE